MSKFKAKWIWTKTKDCRAYNTTVMALREFNLESIADARIRITADSFYRLYVNETWIKDGPARSWPEHYHFDEIDITTFLRPGTNTVRVVARYYGTGDFHRVPRQAGLLAQIEIMQKDGKKEIVATDESWKIALAEAWRPNTPKVSIQMEPAELYDARLESGLHFSSAAVLFEAEAGPWKDLSRCKVAAMSREIKYPTAFCKSAIVDSDRYTLCIPVTRLLYPDTIEAQRNISLPAGVVTILKLAKPTELTIKSQNFSDDGFEFAVNGKCNEGGKYKLSAGKHLVLGLMRNKLRHEKEFNIEIDGLKKVLCENPVDSEYENPWCFIPFDEFYFLRDDLKWKWLIETDEEVRTKLDGYQQFRKKLFEKITDRKSFIKILRGRAKLVPSEDMFVVDPYRHFMNTRFVSGGQACIENASGCMNDNTQETIIKPSPAGDIQLTYDLGTQRCGYYNFEITANEGVIVDVFGAEYITGNGVTQMPNSNRNGMRYITREGLNVFTSLKRRSGRYIFIIFRHLKKPVRLRNFRIIESTYPVQSQTSFSCSDARLDKIWDISKHTMKLCMEDTFTDCPLYEQTLWVGDARNESLFAYQLFGATDIARNCIFLAAQSLERYPIVGCQVPSSWDALLPAWSFLWGISVWEYYWYTGDKKFLRQLWPSVIKNIYGAQIFLNDQGLFSGPFWNLFDWADVDQDQKTVLHNSMFFVGAIDAAINCAGVVGSRKQLSYLKSLRKRLCKAINNTWLPSKKAFPDSIHDDGKPSRSICQHTSFLSFLYNVIDKIRRPDVIKNSLKPPKGMVQVGSPFAMQYLYETLEKAGFEDKIIESIYQSYLPMLEAGATTVWESFPSSTIRCDDFPTRSHCHAWSSAPAYFLPRIILGIKQKSPGCMAFTVSPVLCNLSWAKGSVMTLHGPLFVEWQMYSGKIDVKINAPERINVNFLCNHSNKGFIINYSIEFYRKKDFFVERQESR